MNIVITAQETFYSKDGVNTRAVRGEKVDLDEKQAAKLVGLGVAKDADTEDEKPAEGKPPAKLTSKPQDQPGQ